MKLNGGPELGLDDARKLIRRAVAKAEDLGAAGAFVVVNDGGAQVRLAFPVEYCLALRA